MRRTTMTYHQLASAQFAIDDTDERVTIENVPFKWDPSLSGREIQGQMACLKHLMNEEALAGKALTLVWSSISPA